MLSDPKVNQRGGGVSHIDGREKGSVTLFSLHSSEKELMECHSGALCHKNSIVYVYVLCIYNLMLASKLLSS
jgi:hypothetical protein